MIIFKMEFLIIFYFSLFVWNIEAQNIAILFISNWSGTSTDVGNNMNIVFGSYSCVYTHSAMFVTPGLSLNSQLGDMNTESQRLIAGKIRYEIGYSNNFVNFILPQPANVSLLQTIYPQDSDLMEVVLALVNALYDTNLPKTDILVIISQTNDINNLNYNNYKNFVKIINQQNWYNVKFLNYLSADDTVYQLRKNPFFNIITLLSDDSSNRDLIQKAYLANLMVWKYRWIIANLLGEFTLLQDQTQFGAGVLTNNVTIITFADPASRLNGRNVLVQDSLKLVRTFDCSLSVPVSADGLSGSFSFSPLRRDTFKYLILQNPGSNVKTLSYFTQDILNNVNSFTTPIKFAPFSMTVATSQIATMAKPFRIGYINYPPFSMMNSTNYTGFWMDILLDILAKNNISYTIIQLTDTIIGSRNPGNLTYSHMMGMVQNGIVDTLSVPFIVSSDSNTYFDFSSNVLSGYISVLYKLNIYQGINYLILYTQPFELTVWITFLGCALGIALALAFSDYMFPDKYARFNIITSIFFAISSLTHGAYFDPPRKIGGRVIMSFWWLFSLVVVIIWACDYTALVYKYIRQNNAVQLVNIYDLLKQNTYQYGTLNNNLVFNLLALNNNTNAQLMLKIMQEDINNGTVSDFGSALTLIDNYNFAFIYEDRINTYFKNAYCLSTFGSWLGYQYAYLLANNSASTLFISNEVKKRIDNGMIDALALQYWPASNGSCNSTNPIDIVTNFLQGLIPNYFEGSLDIKFMIGVFIIVIFSAIGTLLVAFVERLIRYIIQIRSEKKEMYNYDFTLDQLNKY